MLDILKNLLYLCSAIQKQSRYDKELFIFSRI